MQKSSLDNISISRNSGTRRNDFIIDIPLAETEDGDIGIAFEAFKDGYWSFRCRYYGPGDGTLMDMFWRLAEQAEIQERVCDYVSGLPKLPGNETRDVVFHGDRITGNGFRIGELIGLGVTVLMPCFSHVHEVFAKYRDEVVWEEIMRALLMDCGGWSNLPKAGLGNWLASDDCF